MADGIVAQGTKLEIGTGSGSAVTTVTATVGFPTIITKSSHGLTRGQVVTLSAFAGTSAALMNGFTVVCRNVTTNTVAVDIDTTGGTLTAANGTLTPVTYAEIAEVTDFDGPSGSASVISMTHLRSTAHEKKMGLLDEGQFTFSLNYLPSDAGLVAARQARAGNIERNFRITFANSTTASFAGYVAAVSTSGSVDGKVTGSITIEITGSVTFA